jgi:hypothetical protein
MAPLSVSRRQSRGQRKNAAAGRREARRSALWIGNPVRRRDRSRRKADQRSRRSAAATFGAPLPSDGGAKGSKPTIWHDSPPVCAVRQRSPTVQHRHGERMMSKFAHMTCVTLHRHARAQPSEGRHRHSRPKDGVASLAYGSPMSRASTPWHQSKAWMAGSSPAMTNVDAVQMETGFWRNEPKTGVQWRGLEALQEIEP